MKKDTSKDLPETPDKPSPVRSYFTKEIGEKVAEMSVKEMESTMKDLVNTPYWIAMIKYVNMRMPLLESSLRATDPVKDPSKISWSQGAMAGLSDIETYVIELNSPPSATEDSEEGSGEGAPQSKPEGTIIG